MKKKLDLIFLCKFFVTQQTFTCSKSTIDRIIPRWAFLPYLLSCADTIWENISNEYIMRAVNM